MKRDPKIALEDRLRKLQESEEFTAYKGLLQDVISPLSLGCVKVLITPNDYAEHNYRVGMLHGVTKALNLVDSILAELERELERDKQEYGERN